jgi:hypothetical protein
MVTDLLQTEANVVIQNNQSAFMFAWVGSVLALLTATIWGVWQLRGAAILAALCSDLRHCATSKSNKINRGNTFFPIPKLDVAGSIPVSRSSFFNKLQKLLQKRTPKYSIKPRAQLIPCCPRLACGS